MVKDMTRHSRHRPNLVTHLLRCDIVPHSVGIIFIVLMEYAILIECGFIVEQHISWKIPIWHFVADTTVQNTHVQDDHRGAVTEPFGDERHVRTRRSKQVVHSNETQWVRMLILRLVSTTSNTLFRNDLTRRS
ncbi:hypothetical protein CDAR_574001 [Caerostris darwini]|uniref:Uncharacterized protein n=1 Tax=Caerostris darwini TaxID=1538125 RepID=A0AAV4T8Y9_9ARAC|nr:hypothetical protein CDAR_574001 [Caerostris darwini]